MVEWTHVGSDAGNTRYSAADTLTPNTVDQLEVAWTWRPADRPRQEFGTVPGSFTSTPIMIDSDADDPDYVGYDADLGGRATFEGGIPLNKPPYAYLVAVDLNAGDVAWRVPFGRGSDRLRAHPALQGLDLPDRLGTPGAPGAIVTQGGLVFVGGGEDALYAFDKRTGREVWSAPLPERSTATPMTYRTENGRQFVLIATGSGASQELVAFATP